MQDYLTKYPKIDAVWCQDDDMAVGVLEAIEQAKRTDIKLVVGGAGSKDNDQEGHGRRQDDPGRRALSAGDGGDAMELTVAGLYARCRCAAATSSTRR